MPRQVGQIDRRKSQDILDAAALAFAEGGLDTPMEAIARRAGVSKQTIYNHYGCKEELLRALFARRSALVVEPLSAAHADEALEDRLTDYILRIMDAYLGANGASALRAAIAASIARPDLGAAVYAAGPAAGRAQVTAFLRAEVSAGRLAIEDFDEAAEILSGMAAGSLLLRILLDAPVERSKEVLAKRARACARRFMRAYAPNPAPSS